MSPHMKVAIEGCCHGELDKIYETLDYLEKKNNIKIDLLLICGDFQAVRNKGDLQCMAVPPKYQKLNTFYKYYSGEAKAPYLTVFIGGNHEASNYLQELPYGGWVAPNIYYLGYAGVIQVGGVRIGGLSGIFKGRDINKGHFEHLPYDQETKRSVYHVRNLEVFRLKQLSRKLDMFMSHDWPRGIYNFGNVNQLLKKKQFLREEIENNQLGSPVSRDLLYHLKPDYWFAAHLHVKFAAMVQHQADNGEQRVTRFLALDKCLPRRKFLQVLDVPHVPDEPLTIQLDPEWLVILKSTNHLLDLSRGNKYMPGPGSSEKWDFKVTQEQINSILEDFGGDLSVPDNFELTAPVHDVSASTKKMMSPELCVNPQTSLMCTMLELTDPIAVFLGKDTRIKPEMLESVDGRYGDKDDDEDDDADDDDTEYESEPSFISMSGSERSFISSSAADDSVVSFNNPNEISTSEENDPNISDIKDMSSNPEEISISDEEDDEEDKAIMKPQKEMPKPALIGKIDKFSRSPLRLFPPYRSPSSSADEKSASPSKSSVTASDIDDTDAELQEILAAQKKSKTVVSDKQDSVGQMELATTGSDDDEFLEIIAKQKKMKSELRCESECEGPISHLSPSSSEEKSDTDVARATKSLELTSGLQKRIDGSESEDSPQSKRLKRRNHQLYVDHEACE